MVAEVVVLSGHSLSRRGIGQLLRDEGCEVVEPESVATWARTHADSAPPVESPQEANPAAVVAVVTGSSDLREAVVVHESAPEIPLVVLVPGSMDDLVVDAARSGAQVAISDGSDAQIRAAVRASLEGLTVLPAGAADLLGQPPLLDGVERQWFRSLAQGRTIASVAAATGWSQRTVHRRLRECYERLGASGKADALVLAAQRGLLD